jgi:hypothetical protein
VFFIKYCADEMAANRIMQMAIMGDMSNALVPDISRKASREETSSEV